MIHFCDIYGNVCFENSMKNASRMKNCKCPMECNAISYSFSLVSTPFNPQKMCPKNEGKTEFLMKDFYLNKYPPRFVRRLIEFKQNKSSDNDVNCRRNIQYRAEVIFTLATDSISVTVISRRLTFMDRLSAFGNWFIDIPS